MKYYLTFCLALIIAFYAPCQRIIGDTNADKPARLSKQETLDQSTMEIIYYQEAFDPENNITRDHYSILQIGKHLSKYSNYGYFRLDSAMATMKGKIITNAEYDKLLQEYNAEYTDITLKHYQSKVLDMYESVFIDYFHYQDELPNFNWELSDSTRTICGQLCHKATGAFRGRIWTAWYCDIAIDNGPWKFRGLPGLILEAQDSKKEHFFSAVAIRKGSCNIIFKKLNYYESKRKNVRDAMLHFVNNYDKLLESLLMNADGSPKKIKNTGRGFYAPLELE